MTESKAAYSDGTITVPIDMAAEVDKVMATQLAETARPFRLEQRPTATRVSPLKRRAVAVSVMLLTVVLFLLAAAALQIYTCVQQLAAIKSQEVATTSLEHAVSVLTLAANTINHAG